MTPTPRASPDEWVGSLVAKVQATQDVHTRLTLIENALETIPASASVSGLMHVFDLAEQSRTHTPQDLLLRHAILYVGIHEALYTRKGFAAAERVASTGLSITLKMSDNLEEEVQYTLLSLYHRLAKAQIGMGLWDELTNTVNAMLQHKPFKDQPFCTFVDEALADQERQVVNANAPGDRVKEFLLLTSKHKASKYPPSDADTSAAITAEAELKRANVNHPHLRLHVIANRALQLWNSEDTTSVAEELSDHIRSQRLLDPIPRSVTAPIAIGKALRNGDVDAARSCIHLIGNHPLELALCRATLKQMAEQSVTCTRLSQFPAAIRIAEVGLFISQNSTLVAPPEILMFMQSLACAFHMTGELNDAVHIARRALKLAAGISDLHVNYARLQLSQYLEERATSSVSVADANEAIELAEQVVTELKGDVKNMLLVRLAFNTQLKLANFLSDGSLYDRLMTDAQALNVY